MQWHRLIFFFFFLADKHSEVEIPGAEVLPTVWRNVFTTVMCAINIHSREATSISMAQRVFDQMGHKILLKHELHTQALDTEPKVRTGK